MKKNKKNGAHVFSAILHTISSPRGDFGLLGSIRYTPFPVTTPKPLSGKKAHLRALDRYPNPSTMTPLPPNPRYMVSIWCAPFAIWCRYGAHHLSYGVGMVHTICYMVSIWCAPFAIWCRYGAHHLLYGVDMVCTICHMVSAWCAPFLLYGVDMVHTICHLV